MLPAALGSGLFFYPLCLTGALAFPEADCQSRFLGAWEYRQRAGDGYDLKLSSNGDLTFTVPERDLFRERPKNLQEVKQKRLTSAGFTRDELDVKMTA